MSMEEYRTVGHTGRSEFTERRSRFLGEAAPVASQREAEEFLRAVRAEHRGASHTVYAYVLREGQARRYSDDGEPQGTAGIPSLNVLLQAGVTDTAAAVTRWFGGILLGTGGLARAYARGASEALAAAGIVTMAAFRTASFSCGYELYGRVAPLIAGHGGVLEETVFTEKVTLRFRIPCGREEPFSSALADAACGSCAAKFGPVKYDRLP
jgi:uncharacterized YigZ family protein